MVEITKRTEAIPAEYPDVPSGLSTAAAALDSDMIWARIESYIAHRWSDRQVIWTVEGPGDWETDLTPATVSATEVWENYAWTAVTLDASALGGSVLPGYGPYRWGLARRLRRSARRSGGWRNTLPRIPTSTAFRLFPRASVTH